MARGRQVIDATQLQGQIEAGPGGVFVDGVRVPLEDVAVVMIGNNTSVSGGALSKLAQYDVVMLSCDWRGVPNYVGMGWSSHSRVGARHRAQAELTVPRRKAAWQAVVRAKIAGQRANLDAVGATEGAKRLQVLFREVRSGDSSNAEAQAARVYWDSIFDDPAFRRVPGGEDRVNSLLNYGYAVMRGFVVQAVAAAGLWPSYGIWHRNRSNTFALADDLIEPFRPAVDWEVHQLGAHADLSDREVKKRLVAVTSCPMDATGVSVLTAIHALASNLGSYVEGNAVHLQVPRWSVTPRAQPGTWWD